MDGYSNRIAVFFCLPTGYHAKLEKHRKKAFTRLLKGAFCLPFFGDVCAVVFGLFYMVIFAPCLPILGAFFGSWYKV